MRLINMMSAADTVKGQGVGSAYQELLALVREDLRDEFDVTVNLYGPADITHYHTINLEYFFTNPLAKTTGVSIGYVHFLPETMDASLKLPKFCKGPFFKYIIAFYKSMDYLVTVNPYFIDKLAEYGIPREKVFFIPNFVSEKAFYPWAREDVLAARARRGLHPEQFTVLSVGQVQTRKGVLDFIETAKSLPDVQFVWAGGFSFGKMTEGFKELTLAMENPPANVKFLGIVERSEMNELYNLSDVFFLPSYHELFPMVILEASACGKPLVLRDIDCYVKILQGTYLKAQDNPGFADLIGRLARDPEFYQSAVDMSREVQAKYSRASVSRIWRRFYNHVWAAKMDRSPLKLRGAYDKGLF